MLENGVISKAVENVVNDGATGHGTTDGACAGLTKGFDEMIAIRNSNRGAVDGENAHVVIGGEVCVLIEEGGDDVEEIKKNAMRKLETSLGKSATRDLAGSDVLFVDGLKELIKLILSGALDEVDEEENERGKRKLSITGKGSGGKTVLFLKAL